MYLKKTVFLVAGISKSGVAATDFLLKNGASVYIFDELENDSVDACAKTLESKGAVRIFKNQLDGVLDNVGVLVLSPGIPIDNYLPMAAKEKNIRIIGEVELAALYCVSPIIAVTGTNGKTTTCCMISHILEKAKEDFCTVGNIGVPFCSKLEGLDINCKIVLEISSFQLETVSALAPHIAVVTNITEDHLERHYNMTNYTYLKSKLLFSLKPSEYAVLNYDDETVRGFAENTRGKVMFVSTVQRTDGAYMEDGALFFRGERIMAQADLKLKEVHNVYNALCALCVCKLLGIDSQIIAEALSDFSGVKHRIEHIANIRGVDYYNDSKSTNVDSTVKALECMTLPTVLILGGKDKGQDYAPLFEAIRKSTVISIVLYGEARHRLFQTAEKEGFKNVSISAGFDSAVLLAAYECENGQAVLLSPACSSFDCFGNFEERGERFISLVNGLI